MVLKVDFWRLIQTLQSVTTPAKPIDIQRRGKSKQTATAIAENAAIIQQKFACHKVFKLSGFFVQSFDEVISFTESSL